MSSNNAQIIYQRGFPDDRQELPLLLVGLAVDYDQEPIDRPNGLPYHTWLYIVSGSGEVIVDGRKAIAHAGMAVLLKAHTPYAYSAAGETWRTHYLTFGGTVSDALLAALHLDISGVYHVSDPANMIRHFRRVERIRRQTGAQPHRLLSKALYAMLLDQSVNVSYISATQAAVQNETILSVIRTIEANYGSPIGLDQLAIEAGLTKEYLCALFKKQMGQTIGHFVQSLRIAHARIFLIQYPERTVSEISRMCGFESASYFCRVFRQVEKVTPQRYRQQH